MVSSLSGYILYHQSQKQDSLPSLHRGISLLHNLNLSLAHVVSSGVGDDQTVSGRFFLCLLIGLEADTNYSYLCKPSPGDIRPSYMGVLTDTLGLGVVNLTSFHSDTHKAITRMIPRAFEKSSNSLVPEEAGPLEIVATVWLVG